MPELNAVLVDWNRALRHDVDGTLSDAFYDEETKGEWVDDPIAWDCESGLHYFYVGDALSKIVPHLEEAQVHNASQLLDLFRSQPIYELETQIDCITTAMSPTTVSAIHTRIAHIDFSTFEDLFHVHCADDKDKLQSFEEDILEYLEQWRETFGEAVAREWGLLFQSG